MALDDPDGPLVEAVQAGDSRAFDALMERHQERIFRFILRHISNEADAVELAQETFVRAYGNISKFRPRGLFSTWLHQIALNLCRDLVRSKSWRNRQRTDSLTGNDPEAAEQGQRDLEDSGGDPSKEVERKEEMRRVSRALDRLTLELKGPLVLTAVEGLSQKEAAELLGLSSKAVEVRVYRARKALAKLLVR